MKKLLWLVMVLLIWVLAYASAKAESACFVVTAYNEWGESGYSQEACCEMVKKGDIATLAWNLADGATGYRIYYRPPWQAGFVPSKSVDVGAETTTTVYAVDVFKIEGIPVLSIQCED